MGFAGAMAVAMAVDALVGWPAGLFARIGHPVTWLGAKAYCDWIARKLHRTFRLPSEAVTAAGRVAEFRPEVRKHRLQDPRVDGSGCLMIEIDGLLHGNRNGQLMRV